MKITPEMFDLETPNDPKFGEILRKVFCETVNNSPQLNAELESRVEAERLKLLDLILHGTVEEKCA